MGTKTYDADASPEKILYESQKFPLQETLGFRLQGMKVYHTVMQEYVVYDRGYCRKMQTENDLKVGFSKYFSDGLEIRHDLVPLVRLIKNDPYQKQMINSHSYSFLFSFYQN